MKKIVVVCLAVFLTMAATAQERNAGQAVVPKGWEEEDSIRFGIFDIKASTVYSPSARTQAEALADSLQGMWEESYGATIPADAPYTGLRRGYMHHAGRLAGWKPDFTDIAFDTKQRIYYPSPKRLRFRFDDGYFWRYIDTAGYTWHENRFDANDISPYAEFDKRPAIVVDTFHSYRYNTTDTVMLYGNEGRVILGYQDNRLANQLLRTQGGSFFPALADSAMRDTAKLFTARLEFNIDTSDIDLGGLAPGALKDTVRLLRVQIAFKDSNKAVLPFIPFKISSNNYTDTGWYLIADTIITYNTYKTLYDSWRARDTLANGDPAQTDANGEWHFKQLHIQLSNMPGSMKNLIKTTANSKTDYGSGDGTNGRINTFQHPDFLVNFDQDPDDSVNTLLEMRVLSTYRAKVRVRSLCYQDTVTDKYLYRRLFGGDTGVHSLNALGQYGGYDDSVEYYAQDWATALSPRLPREFMVNDDQGRFSALCAPMCGYLDYMLSKHNIHIHVREQESDTSGTEWSLHFRRARMSHDAQPPSMFENQYSYFASDYYNNRIPALRALHGAGPLDVFPRDYLIHGKAVDTSLSWPSSLDSMQGMVIGRVEATGDTLKAYRRYTQIYGGLNILSRAYRTSAKIALNHPPHKRSAVELAPQGWALWYRFINPTTQYPHYDQRPTTPEETQVQLYSGLANGATAFNNCQTFEGFSNETHVFSTPGCFGIAFDTINVGSDFAWVHDYNFGKKRTKWGDQWPASSNSNEIDTGMAPHYIGYSNHYRAWKRAITRINQIYGTNSYNRYPFKNLRWLDAYSSNKALGNYGGDTVYDRTSWSNAFLKCVQTTPVKRWERSSTGDQLAYVDSLVADTDSLTCVEVGLFIDSAGGDVNYAAMVVNTRLWPSLRDAEDINYYNDGLDSLKDKAQSTLGDIDTRKVWFTIDTTKFLPSFRSKYYVIRDLWHQDTTYLVHRDSMFGIYIKPGEARLLYIEKDIAIRASPSAKTDPAEFAFNNGRRVAERMGGTRTVVTYTRDGKLYVSYPSQGWTFSKNEQSGNDNLATGNEVLLDSIACARPSITVGRNDISVAITYMNGVNLKAAYQDHPDSGWKLATYSTVITFADPSSDKSQVTPVLTPIGDKTWLVAAAFQGGIAPHAINPGILGARFKYSSGTKTIAFLNDGINYLHEDDPLDTGILKRSLFPTLASRPLPDSMWPVRMAWQKKGGIFYKRIKWNDNNAQSNPTLEAHKVISNGLPSYCYNIHPSIGMAGFMYSKIINPYSAPPQLPMDSLASNLSTPNLEFQIIPSIRDVVTWESIIQDTPRFSSKGQYWPIVRNYTQILPNTVGVWEKTFNVFKPDTTDSDASDFRYPIVSVANRIAGGGFRKGIKYIDSAFKDYVRVAWQNPNSNRIDFAHWDDGGWLRTSLAEDGFHPSLGQTTDSTNRWRVGQPVPLSIDFVGEQTDTMHITGDTVTVNHVRATNGWMPFISKQELTPALPMTKVVWYLDSTNRHACPEVMTASRFDEPTVRKAISDSQFVVNWSHFDIAGDPIAPDGWPVGIAANPSEIHTFDFTIDEDDSIMIERVFHFNDLALLQSALTDHSDTITFGFELRKDKDSTVIATIETSTITEGDYTVPGDGQDTNYAKYKYTGSSDSVFITFFLRHNDADLPIDRSIVQLLTEYEGGFPLGYKRATPKPSTTSPSSSIQVSIQPNPLNQTATVTVEAPAAGSLKVDLYDVDGRKISSLFNGECLATQRILLDGSGLSTGSYFVRIQYGNELLTRRIELIK